MFTGIIACTGRIAQVAPRAGGVRMTIVPRRAFGRLALGESVAVSGACLTVTGRNGRGFTVDVSPETLRRTTLGAFTAGTRVNLERALRLGDRLGGHIVQGHVDGVGVLEHVKPDRQWLLYRFRAPAAVEPYLVEKGSIAIDGVSLTVFSCRRGSFSVALIPHTLAATTLADLRPGDRVNVEADVLMKLVASMVRRTTPPVRRRAARAR
ncbi:MAG TPA: riboflavin synthase [Candidatus Limnocylindria bacterium]|nr:riboflavin synthase [Candidatus Limnocylindria bacterium]